ncbi:MAG TPA: HAMP domain-containing sensor histidine kinase [Phycisphaerae bacterium]|nr:HAMP domain-containing sensor histidine kinase [Phycisphaerae bacterium]
MAQTGPEPNDLFREGALASLLRLQWFIRMRFVMVGVALAALAVERFVVPGGYRPTGLIATIIVTGVVNVVWMLMSRWVARDLHAGMDSHGRAMHRARQFANAQVTVDLLLLTLILRYAGGLESVLAIFYLFHMGIGALLLRPMQAVIQGTWAVVLYACLGLGELGGWIAPHYDLLPYLPAPGLYQHHAYVFVAVLVQAIAVFGTLYFTLRIAQRFGEQEAQLRRALTALRSSRQAIKDLQARRARFMSTAAHQLKSPLAAIETMAGLIRDGYVKDDAAQQTVESIIRRCRDAITGVGDLLTLARVQQADPHRHRTTRCSVAEVLKAVCTPREAEARRKGLTFALDLPAGDVLSAHIDAADLADCTDNLVENAIKYTPGPGAVLVVARRIQRPAADDAVALDFVEIEVTDTGIGIAEVDLGGADARSVRSPIFDAYRRGNGAIEAGIPGSGLGLSIVREVMEQAGGEVDVRSQIGTGSTFRVRVPAAVEGVPAAPAAGPLGVATGGAAAATSMLW